MDELVKEEILGLHRQILGMRKEEVAAYATRFGYLAKSARNMCIFDIIIALTGFCFMVYWTTLDFGVLLLYPISIAAVGLFMAVESWHRRKNILKDQKECTATAKTIADIMNELTWESVQQYRGKYQETGERHG